MVMKYNPARISTHQFRRPQEYFIEEMAARAFHVTLAENRDTISYGDVGELGRVLKTLCVYAACPSHRACNLLRKGS